MPAPATPRTPLSPLLRRYPGHRILNTRSVRHASRLAGPKTTSPELPPER